MNSLWRFIKHIFAEKIKFEVSTSHIHYRLCSWRLHQCECLKHNALVICLFIYWDADRWSTSMRDLCKYIWSEWNNRYKVRPICVLKAFVEYSDNSTVWESFKMRWLDWNRTGGPKVLMIIIIHLGKYVCIENIRDVVLDIMCINWAFITRMTSEKCSNTSLLTGHLLS